MQSSLDAPLTVLLIEDQNLLSDLIKDRLEELGGFHVVTAGSLSDFDEVLKIGKFDIALLDISLDHVLTLSEVARVVKKAHPAKVAIFSGTASVSFIKNCIDLGVSGFIPKYFNIMSMISAVRLIVSGQVFMPARDNFFAREQIGGREFGLTEQEYAILEKLADGMSNKEITASLNVPETTVKMRVRSLCQKLKAENRTQALVFAQRAGLI